MPRSKPNAYSASVSAAIAPAAAAQRIPATRRKPPADARPTRMSDVPARMLITAVLGMNGGHRGDSEVVQVVPTHQPASTAAPSTTATAPAIGGYRARNDRRVVRPRSAFPRESGGLLPTM